jgi:ribosome-binding factor A
MAKSSAPSQRQLRAGELVRHALAQIFTRGEAGDPEFDRLGVSVTEVQMSPDLKIATAFVRPLKAGGETALLAALGRNRAYLRGLVAPMINMKFAPDIRYRIDTSIDYAERIDELLRRPDVARDLDRKS